MFLVGESFRVDPLDAVDFADSVRDIGNVIEDKMFVSCVCGV